MPSTGGVKVVESRSGGRSAFSAKSIGPPDRRTPQVVSYPAGGLAIDAAPLFQNPRWTRALMSAGEPMTSAGVALCNEPPRRTLRHCNEYSRLQSGRIPHGSHA